MKISKTLVLYLIFLVRALKMKCFFCKHSWQAITPLRSRPLHRDMWMWIVGWCWTEMFHSEGYDKCGYRCNQQFSKWKCFAKFWHLASISIQSVAIAISTVWQWNRCQMSGIHLKTIFCKYFTKLHKLSRWPKFK